MKVAKCVPFLFIAVTAGCEVSDRDINTKAGSYFVHQPKVIDRTAVAISGNGRIIAVMDYNDEKKLRIDMRDIDTGKVTGSITLFDDEWPLLLNEDGSLLVTSKQLKTGQSIIETVIANGKRKVTWSGSTRYSLFPDSGLRSFDHGIVVLEMSLLVTSTGFVHQLPKDANVLFDQHGSAWYSSNNGWAYMTKSGKVGHSVRPSYLTANATSERGPWRLISKKTEVSYHGSDARITTIWLENKNAVPYHQVAGTTKVNNLNYATAAVWSGLDVIAYGLVPRRDLVYVVTAGQTYLIPFSISAGPGQGNNP